MLYREIIAVCSQIHTKHINTQCYIYIYVYIYLFGTVAFHTSFICNHCTKLVFTPPHLSAICCSHHYVTDTAIGVSMEGTGQCCTGQCSTGHCCTGQCCTELTDILITEPLKPTVLGCQHFAVFCTAACFDTSCLHSNIVQGVPLATEPGISLIILTPMKVLQRNLNRSTFVV